MLSYTFFKLTHEYRTFLFTYSEKLIHKNIQNHIENIFKKTLNHTTFSTQKLTNQFTQAHFSQRITQADRLPKNRPQWQPDDGAKLRR